jgi:hypothetical protein
MVVTAVPVASRWVVSGVLVVLRAVVAMVVVVVMALRTVRRWLTGVLVVPGVLPVVRVSVVRVSLRVWSGRPVMVVPVVMVAMARTWLIRSLPVAVVARVVSGVRRRPVVVVSAGTAAPAAPGSPMRCRRQARRAPMAVRVAAVETVVGRRRVWAVGAVMPVPVRRAQTLHRTVRRAVSAGPSARRVLGAHWARQEPEERVAPTAPWAVPATTPPVAAPGVTAGTGSPPRRPEWPAVLAGPPGPEVRRSRVSVVPVD